MKRRFGDKNLAFTAEALEDVLTEQLDVSTQDMGLQFRFVITTTPCYLCHLFILQIDKGLLMNCPSAP
jgi:hypothetical protein